MGGKESVREEIMPFVHISTTAPSPVVAASVIPYVPVGGWPTSPLAV